MSAKSLYTHREIANKGIIIYWRAKNYKIYVNFIILRYKHIKNRGKNVFFPCFIHFVF